jgi:hypothetical protein
MMKTRYTISMKKQNEKANAYESGGHNPAA